MFANLSGGRRSVMLVFALALAGTMAASDAAASGEAADPQALLKQNVDRVFVVLRDPALAGGARRVPRIAALRKIADELFDWSEMARSSLGVHWRSLDAGQRGRFVEVFKDVLAAEYMDDIDRFQGTEKVTVDQSVPEGDEVVVRTTLITASRERVPMHYRMRPQQGRWRIIDLSIEGVSLVNHFRKSFASALANMTIDQLIERLQHQLPGS
jgi:phospholipid transport system substrate-binding protein